MKREGLNVCLERADLIRMNQLVRKHIDYDGFMRWYASLEPGEQGALIGELCHCAYQAGVDGSVYEEAFRLSGLDREDPEILMLKQVRGPGGLNIGGLVNWLVGSAPEVRVKAFKWFVFLFGVAEHRLIASENAAFCNHWWHRNLDDPRVVDSLLTDPTFHRTSPRDDPEPCR
jgi:hypothetical protein